MLVAAGLVLASHVLPAAAANLANVYALRAVFGTPETKAESLRSARAWASLSLGWRLNRSAWLAIARASDAAGETDEAVRAYEQALAIDPVEPVWFALGALEESRGRRDRAVAVFGRADAALRFTTVGGELASRGRLREAADLLTLGRQAYPKSGPIAVALGDVMRRQKQYRRAAELYEAAVSIPGTHQSAAMQHLAQLHLSRADGRLATLYDDCSDRKTSTEAGRAACLVELAEIELWIVRNRERARMFVDLALAADPNHTRALTRRAELNLAAARDLDARQDFERALTANRHDPYLLAMAGVAQARMDGQCPDLASAVESAASGLLGGSIKPPEAGAVFARARDECGGNPYFIQAWVFTFVWAGDDAGYRRAVALTRASGRGGTWLPF